MLLMWRCVSEADTPQSIFNAFGVSALIGEEWREGGEIKTQTTFYMTPYPTQKQRST